MICIICGDGEYPRLVARSCKEQNIDFCLLFLKSFCNENGWPDAKHLSINLGEIGKAINFFRNNKVDKIVFAGAVKRPNFSQLSLDKTGISWLAKLGKAVASGDDTLLKAITDLLQQEGFEIIAGTELINKIFLPKGVFSIRKPSKSENNDIQIGIKAAKKIGASDLGQSVIVFNGHIIGEEGSEGTNALIEQSAKLRKKGGVLVKVSKPQQDNRLDLPTIGITTIELLHANGFDGLAIESDKCIVINKDQVIEKINELGMFFVSCDAISYPKKIFIIAGEASGDYLGGKLMEDISELSNKQIDFLGIGGQYMKKAGLKELFSIKELSIIGIFEVISKIFHVKKLMDKTIHSIKTFKPDALITIDSSGFTHRINKKVKKNGIKIPIIHYVAPPVWAWREGRAKSMHKFIDKLLVLFPFEPKFFNQHNMKTVFVGHPIATDPDFEKPKEFEKKEFLNSVCNAQNGENCKIITLLPGSRTSEINKHLHILKEFSELMLKKYKNIKFIIPTIESLESLIKDQTKNWSQQPIIINNKSQKILSYYSSDLAIAASGTVALELARVGLPSIIIYKTSFITYAIVKFLIKISSVCLINILANKKVVPELLQNDCTAQNIFDHAKKLLNSREAVKQKNSFKEIIKQLRSSPKQAAIEVLKVL